MCSLITVGSNILAAISMTIITNTPAGMCYRNLLKYFFSQKPMFIDVAYIHHLHPQHLCYKSTHKEIIPIS